MTITVDPTALAARAREVETLAAAERAKAAEQASKAEAAQAKAQAARAAAEQAEAAARNRAGSELLGQMRAFGNEVRAAERAAVDAIETDPHAVLGLWIAWQALRADRMGKWDALAEQYQRVTGRPAPPGSWGYEGSGRRERYSGSVERDPTLPGAPETFADWLTRTIARSTTRIRTEAKAAMRTALAAE